MKEKYREEINKMLKEISDDRVLRKIYLIVHTIKSSL